LVSLGLTVAAPAAVSPLLTKKRRLIDFFNGFSRSLITIPPQAGKPDLERLVNCQSDVKNCPYNAIPQRNFSILLQAFDDLTGLAAGRRRLDLGLAFRANDVQICARIAARLIFLRAGIFGYGFLFSILPLKVTSD